MYIRVVRAQTQPGQVEELAQRWKAFLGPRFGSLPGFRHAYFGANREANTTVAVSVWDQRPDPATLEPVVEEFRAHVTDISAGTPVFEEYEMLGDF